MNYNKGHSTSYPPQPDGSQGQSDAVSGLDSKTDATMIAEDITVSGDLRGAGTVVIDGTVIGRIILKGTVTVARTGTVTGPIQADSVYVAGTVEGSITAKKCLRLEMTGSITGDVTVSSFTIEDGGHFNGQSHMTKPGEEPIIDYLPLSGQ